MTEPMSAESVSTDITSSFSLWKSVQKFDGLTFMDRVKEEQETKRGW